MSAHDDASANDSPDRDKDPDDLSEEEIDAALEDMETDLDDFDSQLQGILGNKAKMAVIITQLRSARFLAALCSLTDISAVCLDSDRGACAILRNRDGDGPEHAAKDLTSSVRGLGVILAVNRADKVETHLWIGGQEGTAYAPPVILSSAPLFVEDLLTGSLSIKDLQDQGTPLEDSDSISQVQAYEIIGENLK